MIAAALAVLALLVGLNALYVAAEFAFVSARRARIADLADGGSNAAARLLPTLRDRERLDRTIAACQIGITLSSLVVGYYGQARLSPFVAPWLERLGLGPAAAASTAATVLLLALTFGQVVLGELLPKSVALRYPERVALATERAVAASRLVLRPFIAVLNGSALAVLRGLGLRRVDEHEHVHSPRELEAVFRESEEGGLLDAGERRMLANVFHLEGRVVRQIMVPRPRMVGAPLAARPAELLRELSATPHSRFPAFEGSPDAARGIVHIQDLYALARREPDGDLRAIVRDVPLVPESLPVAELWRRLRAARATAALVFDEYGAVTGMATIEDVLEEVFGELQDEFDEERELYRADGGGRVVLRGDLLVTEANERLLLDLPEGEADTVGGLVVARLGRPARAGDVVELDGVRLGVIETEGQAVRRVALTHVGGDGDGGGGSDAGSAS